MDNERIPYDQSYKLLFSEPEMVSSLLQDFVPEGFIENIDFTTLDRVPGSYVTDDCRERHDDIVWRVKCNEEWVYLFIIIAFVRRVGMSIKWITIPPDERGVCAQVSGALTG